MVAQVAAIPADGWYAKIGVRYVRVLYWLSAADFEAVPPTYFRQGIIWHPKRMQFISAQQLSGFAGFFHETRDKTKKVNSANLEQWLTDHGAQFGADDVNRWRTQHIQKYVMSELGAREAEDAGLVEVEEIEDEP